MELNSAYRERNQMIRGDFRFPMILDFYIRGEGQGTVTSEGEQGQVYIVFDVRDKQEVKDFLQDLITHIDDIEEVANEAAPFVSQSEKDKFHRLLGNGAYEEAIRLSRGDQEILDYINSYGEDD